MNCHNYATYMLHMTHCLHEPLSVPYASGIKCKISSYSIFDGYLDILVRCAEGEETALIDQRAVAAGNNPGKAGSYLLVINNLPTVSRGRPLLA